MTNPEAIESLCATVNAYRKARKNIDTSVYVPHVIGRRYEIKEAIKLLAHNWLNRRKEK